MAWANPKVIPASCAHLEFRELEAELIRNHGNVTAAAKKLGVPIPDLRRLVWSTKLANSVYEAVEETLDEAAGGPARSHAGRRPGAQAAGGEDHADADHRRQAAWLWIGLGGSRRAGRGAAGRDQVARALTKSRL